MNHLTELQAEVVAGLRKLTAVPQLVDAVIVSAGDYYAQFGSPSGGHPNELPFEAVGDEFLPEQHHLTNQQRTRLTELGFSAPNLDLDEPNRGGHADAHGMVSPNWHVSIDVDQARMEELAAIALQAMTSAYGVPASDIEVITVPSNPARQGKPRKR